MSPEQIALKQETAASDILAKNFKIAMMWWCC